MEGSEQANEFAKRHFNTLATLCDTAWNLREWIREAASDPFHTLDDVLQSYMPRLKSDLEMTLIDDGLASLAVEMPTGDKLTATSLMAYIEGLRLPGGTIIRPPSGPPPNKWDTMSRYRARMLAAHLCGEDKQPMFDWRNDEHLDQIEQWEPLVLKRIWDESQALQFAVLQPAKLDAEATIPPGHRSKPISKKQAARLLGQLNEDSGVRWLNDCIADGTIACEQQSRQRFVFDCRQFPVGAQEQLRVTPVNSR